eukprot:486055_1
MQTEQLTTDVYTIPTDVSNEGCLVATDHHLYVIGGYHYTHLDTVQILDFSTEEWTNGPSMRETRSALACITHNDYLWAFGGQRETSERISMNPISQNAWQYIDSFQHEVDALRCVAWEETIYIIGMRCRSNCGGKEFWAMVKTVNSVTGISTILSDAPPYPSAWTSPIIVDGILYVFGGDRSGNSHPGMYYYILPTDNQTNDPTKNPLQMQIDNPTQNPSKVPSRSPTPKPTVPSLLTCGQQAIGDYNNQILEFYVRLPSAGDLIFDASSSSFAIQSLTAVFGSTPIGADTDRDGILTLPDAIAADYYFSLRAPNGVYGTFNVHISCPYDATQNPSTALSRSPTPKPTVPSALTCGQQAIGDYNNQILEFYVRLPSAGDLIFDASSSSFAIQSLTAVFGATTIGEDTDHDGILTLPDAIAADYYFSLRAPNGVYGTFNVHISCPYDATQNPSTALSRSPTPKPTVPSALTCGQQAIGDYNNQILEFYVVLPDDGDLIFDASSSSITVQSLTAVFGATTIGEDTDNDGILTLPDAIAADYYFSLQAPNGVYGTFDVRISCQHDQPTRSPFTEPTVKPIDVPTTDTDPPSKPLTMSPTKSLTVPPSEPLSTIPTLKQSDVPSPQPSYTPETHDTTPNAMETLESTASSWIEGSNTSSKKGVIDMFTLIVLSVIGVLLLICGVAIYVVFVSNSRVKHSPSVVEDRTETQTTHLRTGDACLVTNPSTTDEERHTNIILKYRSREGIFSGENKLRSDPLEVYKMNTGGEYNIARDEFVVGGDEDDVTLAGGIEMNGNEQIITEESPAGLQPDEFIVDGDDDMQTQT